ncbi:MAG TPA: hypothetical protein VM529_24920 [Gemmata sp.]|nr:hypothetical protein [Gemmata sp.]
MAVRVRVRCLGVGKSEHTFLSPDPTRVRVCPRCRAYFERDRPDKGCAPVRVGVLK